MGDWFSRPIRPSAYWYFRLRSPVYEHAGGREARTEFVGLALRYVGIHDRAGVPAFPNGIPGRVAAGISVVGPEGLEPPTDGL